MHTLEPCLEIGFFVNNYAETHVCVCDSTELSTLTVIFAYLVTNHPEEVVVQRNHIDLTGDLWNPEAVNNLQKITGLETQSLKV